MKLKNHIAYRMLTDEEFWLEIIEVQLPNEKEKGYMDKAATLWAMLKPHKNHQPRYLCKTVVEKLEYLKVKRKNDIFDWKVFNGIPKGQYTYIYPDNRLFRVMVTENTVSVMDLKFHFNKNSNLNGQAYWTFLYMDTITGERCGHVHDVQGRKTEEEFYKLMCFIHLSETEENIIESGKKWGTRKTGKIINTFPFDLLRIDSTWNVSSIRIDEFGVKGHFAIRWTGKGRKIPKMVWIDPFRKNGYIRKAKKENNE